MPDIVESTVSTSLIRAGGYILLAPDPTPINEVIGVTMIAGGIAWKIASALPYGSVTSYPSVSQPVTSTTGHLPRGQVKKQMRSTSHSSSRRRYYYGKKRKYYRY